MYEIVIVLNDAYFWPRENIAHWVEAQERRLTPVAVEEKAWVAV